MFRTPAALIVRWTGPGQINLRVPSCQYAKKWKYRKPKPTPLPPELFKYEEPISGSAGFSEDLAEVHSKAFEFNVHSMTDRGFLRFQKSYTAPPDATDRFLNLAKSLNPQLAQLKGVNLTNYRLTDFRIKYEILSQAGKEFQYSVPNSMLCFIETIGDALKFYNTNIHTTTPYDELQRRDDLPPNLHIQKEALRFHPETDTMFGGVSAFPKSSTIVTGLRAKKMYQSVHVRKSWV